MEERAKMHLRQWLVAQLESGRYEGLCWEDQDKTMFRIPWKHAAKKDYKQPEDAALFKAWAVYKGKHREGRDKDDPTMWKTRLRCALNKSTDFQEVPTRNQLDITEPYKVYSIRTDNATAASLQKKEQVIVKANTSLRNISSPDNQHHCQKESKCKEEEEEDEEEDEDALTDDRVREHMYCGLTRKNTQNQVPLTSFSPADKISDFRMHVILMYHGHHVMTVTSRSPDGCFILQGRVPLGNEQIYGNCSAQQISFPSPSSVCLQSSMVEAMNLLLCHLERGVLLWVAPDGVFIKRFCQGRVYWSGPMAPHRDRPNKLEREKTFKLLDTVTFLTELQSCLQGKGPAPSYDIELCFGEEYPDPNIPKTRKLIMAKVIPVFAVELLQRFNLGETKKTRPTLNIVTDREST